MAHCFLPVFSVSEGSFSRLHSTLCQWDTAHVAGIWILSVRQQRMLWVGLWGRAGAHRCHTAARLRAESPGWPWHVLGTAGWWCRAPGSSWSCGAPCTPVFHCINYPRSLPKHLRRCTLVWGFLVYLQVLVSFLISASLESGVGPAQWLCRPGWPRSSPSQGSGLTQLCGE